MASKTIKIQCQAADSLPLDAIVEFQGGLKKRGKKEIDLLIKSIEKYGFSFPFMVWQNGGMNYCLDGHGRVQALAEMRRTGTDLPLFPVVYVDAKDEAEAKNKLLRLNSQYGQMTIDSVLEFTDGLDIQFDELILSDESALTFANMEDSEQDMPDLKTGDKEPFQQMTFTLADEQAETIKEAVNHAKSQGAGESKINENSNGNALAYICEVYLGRN